MAKIKQILAREILNGQGIPTIETTVILQNSISTTASVPTGISTGSYEAVEMRDHDALRYHGLGVLKAISSVNTLIGPKLEGMEVTRQQEIDKALIELDTTQNKGKLGANTILSVSMAVAKAAALSSVMPLFLYLRQFLGNKNNSLSLPVPLFTLLEGGKHGENFEFQDFMLLPASSSPFEESLQLGTQVYSVLGDMLRVNNYSTLIGHEGGFSPRVFSNTDALAFLKQAIDSTNYRLGFDVFLGLDVAANFFYREGQYKLREKQMGFNARSLADYYKSLAEQYHILYIEDGWYEDDWEGWKEAVQTLGSEILLAGDDLTATNPYRLQMAIEKKAANGICVKPSQIGTVIESLAVVEVARASGMKIVVSDRGEETDDNFIADFAVAVGADYTKFGAPVMGDRVSKYNRLMQINEHLKALK